MGWPAFFSLKKVGVKVLLKLLLDWHVNAGLFLTITVFWCLILELSKR